MRDMLKWFSSLLSKFKMKLYFLLDYYYDYGVSLERFAWIYILRQIILSKSHFSRYSIEKSFSLLFFKEIISGSIASPILRRSWDTFFIFVSCQNCIRRSSPNVTPLNTLNNNIWNDKKLIHFFKCADLYSWSDRNLIINRCGSIITLVLKLMIVLLLLAIA